MTSDARLQEQVENCQSCEDSCDCQRWIDDYNSLSPEDKEDFISPPTYCEECQWWIEIKELLEELQVSRLAQLEIETLNNELLIEVAAWRELAERQ